MSGEMTNIITQGSEVIELDNSVESTIDIPVNEDYSFIGKVISYTKPKLVVEKAWDKAVVKRQFVVIAKFIGKTGEPESIDIEIGTFVDVYRVGVGNNNFVGTPTTFQLDDASNLTDPSFVAMFVQP